MQNSRTYQKDQPSTGDLAVEGLFAGMAGGLAMIIFLMLSGLPFGEGAVQLLEKFSVQASPNPLQGALLHLAVSGIYGILFGLLWGLLRSRIRPFWLALIYSMVVFLAARFVLLPGSGSPLMEISAARFALAHLIYGAILGFWFEKKW